MDEQWCGSLHVGLTTLAPPELPSCPLSGLSPSLPQLRSKVTWLLCGSEVQRNGALQRQNYCCSLERLKVSWKAAPPQTLTLGEGVQHFPCTTFEASVERKTHTHTPAVR